MIYQSLLDQDLYKFTMAQVVLHRYSGFQVKYRFKCRNQGIVWNRKMIAEIESELDAFCNLRFTEDEITYLRGIRYLKPDFIDMLELYQPKKRFCKVFLDGELQIEVEGPWFLTIFFEVPVLAIVNEVYFRNTSGFKEIEAGGKDRLQQKIKRATGKGFRFSDFGTRRRYSRPWHEYVVRAFSENLPENIFTGTSNVDLARRLNLTPIGTMAHEFIMAGQACEGVTLDSSQKHMLQSWVDEYRGDLGIALTDTLGTKKFLRDFDRYFAKLYDGVRHDSGDPELWGESFIEHYQKLGIDPKQKTFVFSDGLDFDTMDKIWTRFSDRIQVAFGVGTNLTNDFPGITPLQIVMKLVEVNQRPVAKLSDNPSKTMCRDELFLEYLRKVVC